MPPDENEKTQSSPWSSTSRLLEDVVGGTVARSNWDASAAGRTLTLTSSSLGLSTVTRETTFGSCSAYAIAAQRSAPTKISTTIVTDGKVRRGDCGRAIVACVMGALSGGARRAGPDARQQWTV